MRKKIKPFDGLSKMELEEELASRQIYDGKTKNDLKQLLTEPYKENNEFLHHITTSFPPLHDIGHHIDNFFTEFPTHLSPDESKVQVESIYYARKKEEVTFLALINL